MSSPNMTRKLGLKPCKALLTEGVLEELEHDRDDGDEPPVPADEGLAPVAEGVCEDEHVELVPQVVVGVLGHLVVVDATVAAVTLFGDRLAETRVDMFEKLGRGRIVNNLRNGNDQNGEHTS